MMPQSLVIPEKFQHIICILLLPSYTVYIDFPVSAPILSMAAPIPLMAASIPPMGAAIPKWPPPSPNSCSCLCYFFPLLSFP